MRRLMRILHAGGFRVGVGLLAISLTLGAGCASSQEPVSNGEPEDEGNNAEQESAEQEESEEDREYRTQSEIFQERRGEFTSDTFEQAHEELLERFTEQIIGRELQVVGFTEVLTPGREDFYRGIEYGQKDWIPVDLYFDHLPGYVNSRVRELYVGLRRAVTSSPVFGEITEVDEVREDLSRMILESHTPDFSPDAAARLGQFQQAEALVFARLTTSFEALHPPTAFTYSAHWMHGEYNLDIRIVSVERATTLWHDNIQWERTFLLSRY